MGRAAFVFWFGFSLKLVNKKGFLGKPAMWAFPNFYHQKQGFIMFITSLIVKMALGVAMLLAAVFSSKMEREDTPKIK